MSTSALVFMIGSWVSVLSLTAWCFARVLRPKPRSESQRGEGPSNREME